jgi:1,2-diacylglycerol 3-alpha-glucosyltransferase
LKQRGHEIYIFSQHGAKGDFVFGAYSARGNDIATHLFLMASKMTPDIVHIQHEFGLYGEPKGIQVIELILRCRVAGLPVVTTFHTVNEVLTVEEQIVLRVIVQESNGIIVHVAEHKKTLVDYFGGEHAEKIHVIPHGVREVTLIPGARKKVGVEGRKVILLCGYLRKTKRFDRVVRVFPAVAEAVGDAILVIAAKSRSVDHQEYQRELYDMVEKSPAADRITVLHGQFPQREFDTIISAADVVSLPYEKGAQSGIMAHCFAFGKPVVVSNLQGFRNWVEESGGGLVAESDDELERHLITILSDDDYRKRLSGNIEKFVSKKASWRVVSGSHSEVYDKYAWLPTPKARRFG